MLLPAFLTKLVEAIPGIQSITSAHAFTSIFEGILRMAIFLGYMALVAEYERNKACF